MSAFLVEKKTIDRILSLVASECRRSSFFVRELAEKLSVNVSENGWRDKLGRKCGILTSWRLDIDTETKKRI